MRIKPRLHIGILAAFVLAGGCVQPATIPPPPRTVRTVTVLPPNNGTTDELLVSGTSMLEKYVFRGARVTVPDLLADDAEDLLRARGYRVTATNIVEAATGGHAPVSAEDAARMASHGALEGFVLYLEIRRWEPDGGTHPELVIVGVSATLIDAATGREIWRARPPVHPVATPGVVLLGSAYEIAARKVIAELLESWPS